MLNKYRSKGISMFLSHYIHKFNWYVLFNENVGESVSEGVSCFRAAQQQSSTTCRTAKQGIHIVGLV